MADINRIMIEAWNTVLFDKFCRFKHLIADGLSKHSDAALSRCSYPVGGRVLDVGSGFGDCTVLIAQRVGSNGRAVGVDCAANFVRSAATDCRDQRVTNAMFIQGDVQECDLRGPYDHAFSRFGTMFFANPGAAMRNVRDALKPGGSFLQIVWRRREDNPWLHNAELRVKEMVPVVSHEATDQVHCGPGPFSMADADAVSTLLQGAGFERISFERHDCDVCIGRDIDDAIDFAMSLGPAGEIIRLAGPDGEKCKPQVVSALRDVLLPFRQSGGIWAPSSAWFVTASRPHS
jgi:ubiquinone/menaquinone biosynthesis C-methylase UbiE